jgi:hypothetical protein
VDFSVTDQLLIIYCVLNSGDKMELQWNSKGKGKRKVVLVLN